ncbi:hypothetical protein V8C86DRAFT_2516614 [Haematococcus lacustris]
MATLLSVYAHIPLSPPLAACNPGGCGLDWPTGHPQGSPVPYHDILSHISPHQVRVAQLALSQHPNTPCTQPSQPLPSAAAQSWSNCGVSLQSVWQSGPVQGVGLSQGGDAGWTGLLEREPVQPGTPVSEQRDMLAATRLLSMRPGLQPTQRDVAGQAHVHDIVCMGPGTSDVLELSAPACPRHSCSVAA